MSNNLEKVVLSAEHTILDALGVINAAALKVCLIIDEKWHLLGIVTDGDIRRAILKNIELTQSVAVVMNRNPVTISSKISRTQLLGVMRSHGIFAVPVVNEVGQLIGLETWESSADCTLYENPVFIMAGGFGTRLRPLTDNCPKPMLKVGNKPILETMIMQFVKSGFRNIYISTHYMPEQITEYFGDGSAWQANIKYVYEEIPLGTGGALGLLPDDIPGLPLIMINGDVLTTVDFNRLLNFHVENGAAATMCVREYDYQIPYGVITGDGNKVTSMIEKPVHHYFVNAGIYVVSPNVVQSVSKDIRIDMPTLLEQHMNNDEHVLMFPIHEYWLDIGRMEDFKRAQSDIRSLGIYS